MAVICTVLPFVSAPAAATLKPFDFQMGGTAISELWRNRAGDCGLSWPDSFGLTQVYLELLRGPSAKRDGFLSEVLLRTRCVPSPERQRIYTKYGSFLYQMYPDLDYATATNRIVTLLNENGLQDILQVMDRFAGVDRPADCPTKSLLGAESARGPLRRVDQFYGTCYVHATVRAADYLNHTRDPRSPLTSMIATTLQTTRGRASQKMSDVSFGQERDVWTSLQYGQGCQATDWDSLPAREVERRLNELETAKREMESLNDLNLFDLKPMTLEQMKVAARGDKAELQKVNATLSKFQELAAVSARWSPTTMDLFRRASLAVYASAPGDQNDRALAYVNGLILLTQGYREYTFTVTRKDRLLAFADYVFREAYCHDRKIRYAKATMTEIFDGEELDPLYYGLGYRRRNLRADYDWARIRSGISSELHTTAQPLITSICSNIFEDVALFERCDRHSVLVVGQQYDHGLKQCTYQILNSWGDKPTSAYDRYAIDRATGVLWLPSKQFSAATFSLHYLKPD